MSETAFANGHDLIHAREPNEQGCQRLMNNTETFAAPCAFNTTA